jgi:hypothetical protein
MSVIGTNGGPKAYELDEEAERLARLDDLVRSGGYPYIKISLIDPERGDVQIDTHGLREDLDLALAFEQMAGLIRAGALEEVEA